MTTGTGMTKVFETVLNDLKSQISQQDLTELYEAKLLSLLIVICHNFVRKHCKSGPTYQLKGFMYIHSRMFNMTPFHI